MSGTTPTVLRQAGPADADWVAELHADSWRRNYRGAYLDAFLDGELLADRLALWRKRLVPASLGACTLIAERGGKPIGFVHVVFDEDERWGALVDNLHVQDHYRRSGAGRALMGGAAKAVVAQRPGSPLYLWVLEQNTSATAFYRSLGGVLGEPEPILPPSGGPPRVLPSTRKRRVSWRDPRVLIAP